MKMEWKPIETAPKDRMILLWAYKRVYMAYWNEDASFRGFDDSNGTKGWTYLDCEDSFYSESLKPDEPTHWMPLPMDPKDVK